LNLLSDAIITAPESHLKPFQDLIDKEFANESIRAISGGEERQDSVKAGLAQLSAATKTVVIHDAARPFIAEEIISNVIRSSQETGAATVAIPCTDTILISKEETWLDQTPDRKTLWACQTPQVFSVNLIRHAIQNASNEDFVGTDDASLVRRSGGEVRLVQGSPINMKITTQEDLEYAEYLLEKEIVS
jgi:2-C-methyl-D-erythritol 4-phosphate cytidylyltransferase